MNEPVRRATSRRTLVLLVAPLVVLGIVGTVAWAATPYLATHHPLVLIILDSRNRYLILARHVDVVPYLVVGTLRRMLSDPLYFILGRLYGDRAIRWLEREAGGGAFVRLTEQLFSKAAYPMVFFFPGAIPCALAGTTGMRTDVFVVLNFTGTVAMVVGLRLFGDVFASPIESVLGFLNRHLLATTLVTVALSLLSVVLGRLQGRSEIPSIDELESELDAEPGPELHQDPDG